MPIAQLSIDMVAKIATFEADLKRATTATQAQTKTMAAAFDFVGGAIVGMAGALSAGAFATAIKGVSDYADEMGKMSQRVGVSVESLSGLAFAAQLSDVSNESLGNGLKRLSKLMSEANAGMDQQKRILKELGVTETRDANKAFLQIAERFAGMEEGAGKTAAAMAVFGKSGADLIPLLNSGADGIRAATDEAERFGLIVGTDAAKAAEKFNDNLTRIASLAKGAQVSIFGDLIIGLGNTAQAYLDASKEGSKFAGIVKAIQTLFTGDDQHKNNVALVEDTEKLAEAEKALAAARSSGMNPVGIAAREKWVAELKDRLRITLNYRKILEGEGAPSAPKTGKVDTSIFSTGTGGKKAEQISEDSRALASYVEGLQRVLDKNDQLTEKEKALNFLRSIGVTGEIAQVRELTLSMAAQIDQQKIATDVRTAKIAQVLAEGDAVEKANEEYQSLLNRLYAATPQFNIESQRKDVLALTAEFEANRISESLYLEAVTARLDLVADKTDKAKTAADEFGMTMASAFEDAIVGGKDFGTILDSLAQDILRISIRTAVTDKLSGFISSSLTSFLPSFDVGTNYVPRDMVAKIHKGEKIIPAAQNNGSQGGAPIYVTQNFTVGDVASISMVRQAVAGSERRIAAGIGRSMAYGGAMS